MLAERQLGAVTVIDISGRLTLEDSESLRSLVSRLLDAGQRQIVLDVTNLTYVDSSALGEMVACQLRAGRAGTTLKLVNAGKQLQDLLVMTRLITVFEAHDSLPDAIASFSGRR